MIPRQTGSLPDRRCHMRERQPHAAMRGNLCTPAPVPAPFAVPQPAWRPHSTLRVAAITTDSTVNSASVPTSSARDSRLSTT